eukprot:CAMPEP_0115342796 /NCGR_PEP_ID=MMETSP0270-20121206/92395_1 /TAXON_ID=71861 /ORGANISM="Scrippsiella trochoidea, Strain CCMP3099" /LENGTH=78 /DNA_ID=CAMNT_0002764389 /DNA_START=22 /DNA_END=254 /DNA_ORIENTATION=-
MGMFVGLSPNDNQQIMCRKYFCRAKVPSSSGSSACLSAASSSPSAPSLPAICESRTLSPKRRNTVLLKPNELHRTTSS